MITKVKPKISIDYIDEAVDVSTLHELINKAIESSFEKYIGKQEKEFDKEWMSQKNMAKWIGISYSTLQMWRSKGLQVSKVEGRTMVSKTEMNRFLKDHQF